MIKKLMSKFTGKTYVNWIEIDGCDFLPSVGERVLVKSEGGYINVGYIDPEIDLEEKKCVWVTLEWQPNLEIKPLKFFIQKPTHFAPLPK